MRYYLIILFFSTVCSSDLDVVQEDVEIVRAGEDVNLSCTSSEFLDSTALTQLYYCAVAACGEILFGKGAELNFRVSGDVNPTLLALGISNIIFLALVVFLGIKLCRAQNKVPAPQENQNEDSMNYASISYGQKPLNTRRTKSKVIQGQSLYAQVRSQQ